MIVLLHGFWGSPQDFNPVLARLPLGREVWAPDLFETGPLDPRHDMRLWTHHFIERVRQFNTPVTLVGYSMGARLAVQAYFAHPFAFERMLLLSGAPGLFEQTELERLQWEKSWAERFQREDWSVLQKEWQEIPALQGSKPQSRRTSPDAPMRQSLANALLNWSPRHHDFDWAKLARLPSAIEWAFGALDQKYLRVAKRLQEVPVQGQIHIVPECGHRLPLEAPDFISQWLGR